MSKLICPHCGAFTAFSPALVYGKGILRGRSHEDYTEWGEVEISAVVPHEYVYGEDRYAILVCRACEELFVAKSEKYAERDSPNWIAIYPIQHKPGAEEITEPVRSEFQEASLCFAVKAYKACVLMCQIILEHVWHEQGVSGLNQLRDNGIISSQLHRRASEIRLWGNVAKHELIADLVSKEDAEQLLSYLEILLNEVYVEPKRLDSLAQKRNELERQ